MIHHGKAEQVSAALVHHLSGSMLLVMAVSQTGSKEPGKDYSR